MTRRIVDALRRALNAPHQEPSPHFHAHPGNPEVCFEADCARPRLSV